MSSTQPKYPSFFYGLPNGAAKAYFICQKYIQEHPAVLFVTTQDTPDFEEAARAFAPKDTRVLSFPDTDTGRLATLYELATSTHKSSVVCSSYAGLLAKLPAPDTLRKRTYILRRNDTLHRQELLDKLETAGYTRTDYTEAPGDYAARGSVVDVFSLTSPLPLRIYFAGKRIEAIHAFDLDTQTAKQSFDEVVIIPLHFENTPADLTDYLPQTTLILDEPEPDFAWQKTPTAAVITQLPRADATDAGLKANIDFRGNWQLLDHEASTLKQQGMQVQISCLNKGELERLTEILAD